MRTGLRTKQDKYTDWHMYARFTGTYLNKILSIHNIKDRCGKLKSILF